MISACQLMVLNSLPNSLFSLCLSHFRLLVAFRENVAERSAGDRALEFHGASCALLLHLFLHSLLVLAPIQHRPVHLTWVALRLVQLGAFGIYKVEGLIRQTHHNGRTYPVTHRKIK